MNSLYNQLNQTNQTTPTQGSNIDQIKRMMNMIQNSQNPSKMLEELIRTNPQMQNVMNLIRQNGGDAKAAFYNLAKEKGIDPEQILSLLR